MIHDDNTEFFMSAPTQTIQAAIPRTERAIYTNDNIICSISGGADSDDMLDMVYRLDNEHRVKYVFIDTGIEMSATKRHIEYLQQKYGISIETIKPKEPVPIACKKHGLPFHSKQFSENISRLQKHGFKWEDKPFEELYAEYPHCKSALKWWCNMWGENSMMNINSAKHLKEFMIANPPDFKISNKCCDCAKKRPAYELEKSADITFIGIRKAEGGARAVAYTNCFAENKYGQQHFPLFWWKTDDKTAYEEKFGIVHSEAYSVYGCKRTGCAGCPFGSGFETELAMLEKFEPKLAVAANNIFGKSYEYTRAYRDFRDQKKKGK